MTPLDPVVAQSGGQLLSFALTGLRLIVFALALGLTLISFQAYSQRPTERLQWAFIGFAFISMGVAMSSMSSTIADDFFVLFEMAETIPFIIGFTMLFMSLYR